MKDNSVKVQLLYFFAVLMGLLCFGLSILNFFEIKNIQQNNPEFYLFLPKTQGLTYSVSCSIVFTTLFVVLCRGMIKRNRITVIRASLGILLSTGLSIFLYHLLTNFIEFGI